MWLALALAALLAGCAGAFPPDLVRSTDRAVTVADLRADPAAYAGKRVMVGGDILATRPRPGETEIELLAKPIGFDDQPERGDVSAGRVLVRTREFLDPAVYAEGRRMTVIGTVAGGEERAIGELPYRYPVIAADRVHLWPRDLPPPPEPWANYYGWPTFYGGRYHYYPPWPGPPYWW